MKSLDAPSVLEAAYLAVREDPTLAHAGVAIVLGVDVDVVRDALGGDLGRLLPERALALERGHEFEVGEVVAAADEILAGRGAPAGPLAASAYRAFAPGGLRRVQFQRRLATLVQARRGALAASDERAAPAREERAGLGGRG